MKNNFRIVNILKIVFMLFYKLSIFGFVIMVFGHLVNLFNPENTASIKFLGTTVFNIDTTYDLVSGDSVCKEVGFSLSLDKIESSGIFYRLIAFFDTVISGVIIIFMFRYAYYIFEELHERGKNGNYFSEKIYHWIRRVGFLMLAKTLYFLINGSVISWYFLDNVRLMGQEVHFYPDYTVLTKIISVLVVFVFAEIYRAGIEMKEESEFTI
ncbi:DUF2975 domain-containing protein [Ancylomarina sp.]|uniref:DUF2975 domain-containing protein n=1 Tax=Ancylomarina sp. TaxID=1970196 RepID=UPI0035643D38